ncbi:MAG: hypothetical protein ACTSYO_00430 [Candidatus Ranarchaeia archaeon]
MPLHPWNLYVLHRDGIIDFRKLKLEHWKLIGDFILGRIFDVHPDYSAVYENDEIRINPAYYEKLAEIQEYILFRSFFYMNSRPLFLHKDPIRQPVEHLLKLLIPLFRFYGIEHVITVQQARRLLNNAIFTEWARPITENQAREALKVLATHVNHGFRISNETENSFRIHFNTEQSAS